MSKFILEESEEIEDFSTEILESNSYVGAMLKLFPSKTMYDYIQKKKGTDSAKVEGNLPQKKETFKTSVLGKQIVNANKAILQELEKMEDIERFSNFIRIRTAFHIDNTLKNNGFKKIYEDAMSGKTTTTRKELACWYYVHIGNLSVVINFEERLKFLRERYYGYFDRMKNLLEELYQATDVSVELMDMVVGPPVDTLDMQRCNKGAGYCVTYSVSMNEDSLSQASNTKKRDISHVFLRKTNADIVQAYLFICSLEEIVITEVLDVLRKLGYDVRNKETWQGKNGMNLINEVKVYKNGDVFRKLHESYCRAKDILINSLSTYYNIENKTVKDFDYHSVL